MKFNEEITKLRENRKMTKNQLAILSGISSSELAEIESGKRIPQAKTLKKLADALGCDYSKLYEMLFN